MKRNNPKYFVYQDVIGMTLYAKSKFNPIWTDYRPIGIIMDESKNMLLAKSESGYKKYIKNQYIFQVWLPQASGMAKLLQFDGSKLVGRPENRIKQIRKNRRKFH
jgi:RNase P/RNase MRP subunit p29